MNLKYYHIDEESAIRLAKCLKPTMTTGKFGRLLKKSKARGNKAGFPMLDFFPKEMLDNEENPEAKELIGGIGYIMAQTGRDMKWCCERLMHDVGNGLVALKRQLQEK